MTDRTRYPALLALVGLVLCAACSASEEASPLEPPPEDPPAEPEVAPARAPIAFENVSVRAMDGTGLVAEQTVFVDGDSIVWIGPAAGAAIPPNATRVDGSGRVLVPGLADMHTHVRIGPLDDTDATLRLSLAKGVTTLFNMGDFSGTVPGLRDSIAAGHRPGPRIWSGHFARAPDTSPIPQTTASTPAEGRALVRLAAGEDDDFIKVYSLLAPDVLDAIISEARASGLPVVGHGVRSVGMEAMLDAGVTMVAHAEEFLYAHFPGSLDASLIPEASDLVASRGAAVTATVSTYEGIAKLFDANRHGTPASDVYLNAPGAEYLPQERLDRWAVSHVSNYSSTNDLAPALAFQLDFLASFDAAGVELLLGSDAPVIPGLVPGFAILREMELLRGAGIPAEAVLRAGTSGAGDFIERSLGGRPGGRILPGYRADLVLLDSDPVADLSVFGDPVGTLADGRWYDRETLRRWLEALRGG